MKQRGAMDERFGEGVEVRSVSGMKFQPGAGSNRSGASSLRLGSQLLDFSSGPGSGS